MKKSPISLSKKRSGYLLGYLLWVLISLSSYTITSGQGLYGLPGGDTHGNDEANVSFTVDGSVQKVTMRIAKAEDPKEYDHIAAVQVVADLYDLDGNFIEAEFPFILGHTSLINNYWEWSSYYGDETYEYAEIYANGGWRTETMRYWLKDDISEAITVSGETVSDTYYYVTVAIDTSHPSLSSWADRVVTLLVQGVYRERDESGTFNDRISFAGPTFAMHNTGNDEVEIGYSEVNQSDSDITARLWFNVESAVNTNYFQHIEYLDIDYSLNGGSYRGLAYIRHANINSNYNPWASYEDVHLKDGYKIFFANDEGERDGDVPLTFHTYNEAERNRMELRLKMAHIPRFRDANNVTFRIRGKLRNRSYKGDVTVNVEQVFSESIQIKEEDGNPTNELDFTGIAFDNAGSNRVGFNLEKREGESFYDHVGCLVLYYAPEGGSWNKLATVRHNSGIFSGGDCNPISNPGMSETFSGPDGDTYTFTTSQEGRIFSRGASIYTSEGDVPYAGGDAMLYVTHYIKPEDFGKRIYYKIGGTYYEREFYKQASQTVLWNNAGTEVTVDAFSEDFNAIPDIGVPTVQKTATGCGVEISWTEPTATFGDSGRHRIIILRNGEQIAYLDAHDVAGHSNKFVDTDIERRKEYAYQVVVAYDRYANGPLRGKPSQAVNFTYPLLDAPYGLVTSQSGCGGTITVDWQMDGSEQSEFKIQRKDDNSSFQTVATVSGGLRTYNDNNNIEEGKVYYYQMTAVDAVCGFEGKYTEVHTHTGDTVDISKVIAVDGLETSKGYFTDRTELFWETTGQNEAFATRYKIFGRELGSTIAPVLLQTVDRDTRSWFHERGDASVIYEYFVVAERVIENECGIQTTLSYPVEALEGEEDVESLLPAEGVAYNVGLRSPSAVVNGNITYSGGIAVPNVKVIAERDGEDKNKSLYFDGTDYILVPHSNVISMDTAMTLSTWLKFEDLSQFAVVLEKQGSYGMHISPDGSGYFYIKNAADASEHSVHIPASSIVAGNWMNITASYRQSTRELKLYLNGELYSTEVLDASVTGIQQTTNMPFSIGRQYTTDAYYFQGYLDETRLYNRALSDDEVLRESGRITTTDARGLVAYWKVFEGAGKYIYDAAHLGSSYYKNDGLIHGASWSDDTPSSTQLGIAGYTDDAGNYTIAGVTYTGNGENFKIIPTITLGGVVHEFDPGSKVVFLGEGNVVENGVDFEDISSFEVSGKVVFDYGDQNAGSEDVGIYLDGIPVSDGFGNVIKTDENGEFTISVPIGEHIISVQKGFHDFENDGVWPANQEPHDFQEGISGLVFLDQTVRKVAGRVVGGTREGDKPVGFDKSVNNIGQAQFKLVSENGLIEAAVTTDASSGEYEVELPPYNYLVYRPSDDQPGIDVPSNPAITFSDLPTIDISEAFTELIDRDTVFVDGEVSEVNEYSYHLKQNFIYRNAPMVQVKEGTTGLEGENYLGERATTYTDKEENSFEMVLTDASGYKMGYPVYQMAKRYGLKIAVFETYTNYDGGGEGVEDIVPVSDANIYVSNTIGPGFYIDDFGTFKNYPQGSADELELSDADGDTTYYFTADEPNLNVNASTPALSYTRSIGITVVAGGNTVSWPNPADASEAQYAYVLGSRGTNTNFVTKAPDLVEFILRDPPGSESYASIAKGESFTKSETKSLATAAELDFNLGVGLGLNTLVGGGICGVGEVFEVKAEATLGFNVSTAIGEEGEKVSTYEFAQAFETNSDNIDVGADGDLYIGKSENFLYGISDNLLLIPAANCGLDEVYCVEGMPSVYDADGNEYKMGRRYGFYLVPDGEPTYFIYSQNHIENYLIPDLIALRNTVLANNPKYLSHAEASDPLYGSNNDDPRWGASATTDSPETTEPEDLTGPSYTFTYSSESEIDSVRWYNQQIRLWKDAMAENEKEKIEAINAGVDKENYSISGGAVLSNEKTYTQSSSKTRTFELAMGVSAGASMELDGYGVSVTMGMEAAITSTIGTSSTITDESSITYEYVLNDPDVGDFMSVDVYPGVNNNGPIFSILGGQTMCPYEEEITSKYYQPGTVLSNGTLQREKPKIDVAVAEVFNVPADEAAVFTLTLFNESESFDDQLYTLEMVESTNPNGAILEIDGATFNTSREYLVPGSGAINKTLTMKRGPFEYDYENIQIVIRSLCQYDPTDNDVNITDTVSISAHFIPICTDVSISSPGANWVGNSTHENNIPVVIDEFNINYAGFEYIDLQYKPSEAGSWTTLETFYRESEDPEAVLIPRDNPVINYSWNIKDLPDANYDLRAVTSCVVESTGENVTEKSEIMSGLIDRVNPHPFGTPQPADGIYSAGDEIEIQFNEPIHEGLIRPSDFAITGVLNGGDIRHNASVFFGGNSSQYMKIADGINLTRKSFSIDLYVKRQTTGKEILFAQGGAEDRSLILGFDATNHPYLSLNGSVLTADLAITDNNWHHLAFVYDHAAGDGLIYDNGAAIGIDNSFEQDYQSSGQIFIAKSTFGEEYPFTGNIHELRVWNIPLSESEVNLAATKRMSASTRGLVGNWRMEEARGTLAQDHVRSKHAEQYGEWMIEPGGLAYSFDGTNHLEAISPSFSSDADFTVEFWVKGSATADSTTFISNGRGDSEDSNLAGWAIGTNTAGELIVKHRNAAISTSALVLDDAWHHVALTLNRFGNVTAYVDGVEAGSINANVAGAFGGSKLWIGTRGWYDGSVEEMDQPFSGAIDEIRVWSLAKRADHIVTEIQNKLSGDETGLVLYYPFESYQDIGGGILDISQEPENQVVGEMANTNTLAGVSDTYFDSNTAAIKLPRPVSSVNFNYSSNGDRVILSPTVGAAEIEDATLTISVKNIRDLNGNKLLSPVSWTAFVDRSTLNWVEPEKNFDVPLGEGFTFTADIYNRGGNIENYELSNLPGWLQASPASGSIEPLTSKRITFTVSDYTNIGNYVQDIVMENSFGFDERMILNLKVYQNPPEDWVVDPAAYEYSMSVLNRVRIKGEFSRDEEDLIAAFVDGECRGVAALQYSSAHDHFHAFLSVYSNELTGETIDYRIWNASEGLVHTFLISSNEAVETFSSDAFYGSVADPVIFDGDVQIERSIETTSGWQWLSFNLSSAEMNTIASFMADYPAEEGDQVKSAEYYDQYDEANGWLGTISANGGIKSGEMYKFRLSNSTKLKYRGEPVDPTANPVTVAAGWNWISFLGQNVIPINEALSNVTNLSEGDVIKGQRQFATYGGPGAGWVGTLKALMPGEGYMYKANLAGSIVYPKVAATSSRIEASSSYHQVDGFDLKPEHFPNNMDMILEAEQEYEYVLAYAGDDLRGIATAQYNPAIERFSYFMTAFGSGKETLQFKGMLNGELYDLNAAEKVIFSGVASYGTLSSPLKLGGSPLSAEVGFENDIMIYPNPVQQYLLVDVRRGDADEVQLTTITGQVLLTSPSYDKENHVFRFDVAGLTPGMYLIQVKVDGKTNSYRIIKE